MRGLIFKKRIGCTIAVVAVQAARRLPDEDAVELRAAAARAGGDAGDLDRRLLPHLRLY